MKQPKGCFCHLSPPCNVCTDLTEDQIRVLELEDSIDGFNKSEKELEAKLARVTAERDKLILDMQGICEYWNQSPESAVDAIEEAIGVCENAINEAKETK